MAFYVYRSNRLDRLASALAEVLRTPTEPVDPLRPETLVVQSRVLGRWLSLRLAEELGIFACGDLPFPRRVLDQAFDAVLCDGEAAAASVFTEGRLTWAIARLLPRCIAEHPEAFDSVHRYLEGAMEAPSTGPVSGSEQRLFSLAGQVAALFDRYLVYRPDWMIAWEHAPEDHWQSLLWHRLVSEYGGAGGSQAWAGAGRPGGPAPLDASLPRQAHLARRAQAFHAALRVARSRPEGLPPRICLFGIRTLPPLFIQAFASLGAVLDVHLFTLSPSAGYFGDLRREDVLEDGLANPLLASMGRLGRDFQALLEKEGGDYQEAGAWFVDPAPLGEEGRGNATFPSALEVLQSDILNQRHRRPGGGADEEPLPIHPEDRSIVVHACFSPMREVEALRDVLLDLFERQPDLQPRDVVVMAPAMDVYAPYVEAVFGVPPEDPTYLPFGVADRPARAEEDVRDAFLALLELLSSRLGAPEVLDLLAREPVRDRFGISQDGLGTVTRWIEDSGVRWAEDAEDRARFGQPPFAEYTWRYGLDRLLLSYAATGDGWTTHAGVLPLGHLEGEAALLGSLLDFSEALFLARREMALPAQMPLWRDRLCELMLRFLDDSGPRAWSHQALRALLNDLLDDAEAAGFEGALTFETLRDLLRSLTDVASPPREVFSGGITFCSLLPMRSVPFRVVVLLGLCDDEFPRADRRRAFDRMAQDSRPGDRSQRQDDRYQFLEALLAASERLLVFYVGQDVRDQRRRPPSVVMSELLDALGESFSLSPAEGCGASRDSPTPESRRRCMEDRLVIRHPLHSYDPRYFAEEPRPSGGASLFSYCEAQLKVARAMQGPMRAPMPFLESPLPPPALSDRSLGPPPSPGGEEVRIPLGDLERFWRLPCRFLLERRLALRALGEDPPLLSREPLSLDALAAWQVREILLDRLASGQSLSQVHEVLRAAGRLPLGEPGRSDLMTQMARVAPLADRLGPLWAEAVCGPLSLDPAAVMLEMNDGTRLRLTGAIGGLRKTHILEVRPGLIKAGEQLVAWIRHLALCAAAEGGSWRGTVLAGPGEPKKSPEVFRFPVLTRDEALHWLGALMGLYIIGQQVPLRFFPKASMGYVRALDRGLDSAEKGAAKAFFQDSGHSESEDPAVARLFDVERVLGEPFGLGIRGAPDPALSFPRLAREVFGPLLATRQEGVT